MPEQQKKQRIHINLNGVERQGYGENRTLLSDFIRHELGATGTHVGCAHGVCGACTVLVDGVLTRSCLYLAKQAEGSQVQTIEGLAQPDGTLSQLQSAFSAHHALQCGFCTAGILMSCTEFLQRTPNPSEKEIRDMLSGHLCRCTGYTPIVNAVLDVVNQLNNKTGDIVC